MDTSLLRELPSALSAEYIRRLLDEDGVREFRFETRTPRDVMDGVKAHRWTVSRPERDPLCQRLAVLAAFCAHWLNEGSAWDLVHTIEPSQSVVKDYDNTPVDVLQGAGFPLKRRVRYIIKCERAI